MSVPQAIRDVPRPVNTIVEDNGKDSLKRYSVRQRGSSKYVPGGNPQPHNGKVVGHIINGKYVPISSGPAARDTLPDMLSYGASALVKSVSEDIFRDLLAVYDASDAGAMMAVASLRVIKPSIAANRIQTHYNRTFVCRYYPGAALSRNSVGNLFQRIGMDGSRRRKFYELRLAQTAADHHIAIDGMLKQDNSTVNDLSAYSRKARVRGCCEVSVLYAYDIEKMEPVCAEVFPGNSIDASSYPAFIRDNDIRRGILVGDKGFPPSKIRDELKDRPELHFLTPIRRNDVRISDNDMLSFEGIITGIAEQVVYKKKQIKGGRFLYAFKDAHKASYEEATYLANAKKKDTFSPDKYASKKNVFGTIVLESDQDLDPKTAYLCYEDRWLIELVFNRYKSDECLDHTDVQGDFSVIGSEFVNFLSTVMTCRIIRKAEKAGLLDDMSYAELMDDLSAAWRRADAPGEPVSHDDYWVHTLEVYYDEMEKLGICKPLPKPEPKKRGRKPKPKDPELQKPKRPRGRPRKNPIQPAG